MLLMYKTSLLSRRNLLSTVKSWSPMDIKIAWPKYGTLYPQISQAVVPALQTTIRCWIGFAIAMMLSLVAVPG